MVGTLGNTYIDTILGEYVPINETNSSIEELLTDESDQLLYALLVELRASRFDRGQYDIQDSLAVDDGNVDVDATYRTETFDAAVPDDRDDWKRFDLDFVTEEIDLRFSDAINVALVKQPSDGDIVQYNSADSPVVGIPASTSWIWVSAQDGTGGASVTMEAWGDN